MSKELKKIIKSIPAGEKYTDPEFSKDKSETVGLNIDCVWKRPEEFMSGTPKLYHDGISVDDIVQGKLGDCYFLGSLAAIAENPRRIKSFFRNNIENDKGVYCVTFFYKGVETDVIVDDYFPVLTAANVPAFSRCVGPELWVLLLEKAYAKLHGSYAAIEGGNPGVALADLTGGPSYMYKLSETQKDTLWGIIVNNDRKNNIMCCNVGKAPDPERAKAGLIEGHAYSLIDARDYKGEHLVHIRNPWGRNEWNGKWSDGDTASWTPEALLALNHKRDADDGTFWMPYECFCRYFESVIINVVEEGWGVATSKFTLTSRTSHFPFRLTEASEIYLTLRIPRDDFGVRACIVSKSAPHIPFGGTSEAFTGSAVVSTENLQLDAGEYYAIVDAFPQHAQTMLPLELNISFYCSDDSVEFVKDPENPALKSTCGFVIPHFEERYGACAMCGCALTPAHANIQGKKYHPACIMCHFCGTPLGNAVFVNSGYLACKACASDHSGVATPYYGDRIKVEIQERIAASKSAYTRKCAEKWVPRKSYKKMGRKELQIVYNSVRGSDDKEIPMDKVPELLDKIGIQKPKDDFVRKLQIDLFSRRADQDGNGTLSFKELNAMVMSDYLKIMNEQIAHLDRCTEVFHSMDDQNGVVRDAEALFGALTAADIVSKKNKKLKKHLGNGEIGFEKFVSYCIRYGNK